MKPRKTAIYFYTLAISGSEYGEIVDHEDFFFELNALLDYLIALPPAERRMDLNAEEKIIWLDSFVLRRESRIFEIVIKSAKYNQVRDVIDTKLMTHRGKLKNPADGDEEKNYLLLLCPKNGRDICLYSHNHYGVSIAKTAAYLSKQFAIRRQKRHCRREYAMDFPIFPGVDFLIELRRMKKITLCSLELKFRDSNADDFLKFAKRDQITETILLEVACKGRQKSLSPELISRLYQSGQLRAIKVGGFDDVGAIKLDSKALQLKRYIEFAPELFPNEIANAEFFNRARELMRQMQL